MYFKFYDQNAVHLVNLKSLIFHIKHKIVVYFVLLMGAAHHICWLEYCFLPFTLFCKLMPPLEVYTLHLKAGSHPNAGLTSCVQNNLKNSLWVWTSVLESHFSHHFPPFHIKRKHKIEKIVQKGEKWPKSNNLTKVCCAEQPFTDQNIQQKSTIIFWWFFLPRLHSLLSNRKGSKTG